MTLNVKVADLLKQRAAAFTSFEAIAAKDDFTDADKPAYDAAKQVIVDLDEKIARVKEAQAFSAKSAQPAPGQDAPTVPATVENDPYIKEKSLLIGGIAKTLGVAGGNAYAARQAAAEIYGDSHPVTKALITSVGSAGGFLVPPDVMNEVIPLLRSRAVVRAAGPRNIPMPRGTMTLPGQSAAATAYYGTETGAITKSQQSTNALVASFRKLTALVPVSNDMMRYANPAVDAFVRDDLVKVMALKEDYAFMFGQGDQSTPKGFLAFANQYGLTVGVFSSTGNSTAAAGGNWVTSTAVYTLTTVAQELGGLVNKLDTANVPNDKRAWFMHPRSWNYLNNVQNSLGVYVYRDELTRGTLLGYPVFKSTQIPVNIKNTDSSYSDCSFVFLVEMTEAMIFDSMQLELAVSREGTYVDENSATISAFQYDQTIIRAVAEHDFLMRHDASVAAIQFVRWAPAIS